MGLRLTAAGAAHIDQRAAEQMTTRSEMARRMLTYAAQHMPQGWRPRDGHTND
jgi:hypothetical protein